MAVRVDWKYYLMPAFIARECDGRVEIRNLVTDEWIPKKDISFIHTLVEDGSIVPEEVALQFHEQYKKTLT